MFIIASLQKHSKKMTERIKQAIQSRLPPSSPIKSHLFLDETFDDYRFESTRLESFKNWPWISGLWIKPEKLAAAGFYYTGKSDNLVCFECRIVICGKWQVDDNPMAYHQRWSQECRFINNIPCANVPIGTDPNTIPEFVPEDDEVCDCVRGDYGYFKKLVICKLRGMASRPKRPERISHAAITARAMALKPRDPEYASYAARLASFDGWPKAKSQTKEALATAGFCHTGSGYQILCCHCGRRLRNWKSEDNFWKKHVRLSIYCPYVILTKGTEFVRSEGGSTRAEKILSVINKLNEKIEKNIDAESIDSGSTQNSIYSEETNTAKVSAASGEASSITGRTDIRAEKILFAVNKFGVEIEESSQNLMFSILKKLIPNWFIGEASSKEQFIQGDKPCDENVHKGILTNIKKMTECVEHYAIPQCRLPPSSPIKSHLFFDETYADYRFESTRLESFKNWPWTSGLWIKPEKLAAAGFYYTGESDKVKCFECPIEIYGKWQVDDNPMAYHERWSAECRFINNIPCGNVPIGTDPNTIPEFVPKDDVDVHGINNNTYFEERVICKLRGMASRPKYVSFAARIARGMASRPKYPEYAIYAARLASFDRWPKAMSQTKETLATAGFYYTGSGDQTLCYHCGGGIKDWESECDPWVEHANRFAYCPYVILTRGTEFVSSITGRTDIGADDILSACNKLGEQIEKFYSEEINTSKVSAALGKASSEEQFVQGDKPCDEDEKLCKICHSREAGILFMPCRHLLACAECAKNMKICGVCHKPVEHTVQARILL